MRNPILCCFFFRHRYQQTRQQFIAFALHKVGIGAIPELNLCKEEIPTLSTNYRIVERHYTVNQLIYTVRKVEIDLDKVGSLTLRKK